MEKIKILTTIKEELLLDLQPMGISEGLNVLSAKITHDNEVELLKSKDALKVTLVSGDYTKDYECAGVTTITKDVLTGVYTIVFNIEKFAVLKLHTEQRIADLESQNALLVDQNALLVESVLDMSTVVYGEEVITDGDVMGESDNITE